MGSTPCPLRDWLESLKQSDSMGVSLIRKSHYLVLLCTSTIHDMMYLSFATWSQKDIVLLFIDFVSLFFRTSTLQLEKKMNPTNNVESSSSHTTSDDSVNLSPGPKPKGSPTGRYGTGGAKKRLSEASMKELRSSARLNLPHESDEVNWLLGLFDPDVTNVSEI